MDFEYRYKIWVILCSVSFHDIEYACFGYEKGITIALEEIPLYLSLNDSIDLISLIGYIQQCIIAVVLPASPINHKLLSDIRVAMIINHKLTSSTNNIISMIFTLALIYPKITINMYRNEIKEAIKYVYTTFGSTNMSISPNDVINLLQSQEIELLNLAFWLICYCSLSRAFDWKEIHLKLKELQSKNYNINSDLMTRAINLVKNNLGIENSKVYNQQEINYSRDESFTKQNNLNTSLKKTEPVEIIQPKTYQKNYYNNEPTIEIISPKKK